MASSRHLYPRLLRPASRALWGDHAGICKLTINHLRQHNYNRFFTAPSRLSQKTLVPNSPPEDSNTKFLGTTKRLPEFNLTNRVILITGAARGLGLALAEACLEAGATIYALDRLPPSEQSPDFSRIQRRAENDLGARLHYRQIDVRDVSALNKSIEAIGNEEGRLDGLIAGKDDEAFTLTNTSTRIADHDV